MADVNLGLRQELEKLRAQTQAFYNLHSLTPVHEALEYEAQVQELLDSVVYEEDQMPPSQTNNNLVEMRAAVRHAQMTGEWVVMLAPQTALTECGKLLAVLPPEGANFSGRTMLMPGGGKVSLAAAEDEVFVPDGTEFVVGFITGYDSKGAQKWQAKAKNLLRVSA